MIKGLAVTIHSYYKLYPHVNVIKILFEDYGERPGVYIYIYIYPILAWIFFHPGISLPNWKILQGLRRFDYSEPRSSCCLSVQNGISYTELKVITRRFIYIYMSAFVVSRKCGYISRLSNDLCNINLWPQPQSPKWRDVIDVDNISLPIKWFGQNSFPVNSGKGRGGN